MDLIDSIKNLSVSHRRSLKDDDFLVDRLHHRYTVAALVIFCAVVTTNQYAGEPINCWVPAQFTGSFETYTNRLCWLQNTYYVDENQDIPDDMEERHKSMLKYYQWIHLIILLQSMLFIIPRVIWRSLNDKCGIEIYNYVDAAIKYENVDKFAEREKLMDFLSGHISTFIQAKDSYKFQKNRMSYKIKRFTSYLLFWTGKRFGNYLIILYVFCKLMYLANVFGQLFLMTKLLGIDNYYLLGFEILKRMASGLDMINNHYFPKVTHCDFKVRELGNDHQYTVQCVLTINIFTEKIYIILWFWFVILTIITFIDLITFLIKNCWSFQRYKYVKKHVLVFSSIDRNEQKNALNDFALRYLRPDIVLVLKILSTNVNGLVVSELVKKLWESYNRSYNAKKYDVANNLIRSTLNDEVYDDDNNGLSRFPNRDKDDVESLVQDGKKLNKTNFLNLKSNPSMSNNNKNVSNVNNNANNDGISDSFITPAVSV